MSTTLLHGDCLDALRGLDAGSVGAVVTDPPYGLVEPRSVAGWNHAMRDGRTEEQKEQRRGGFMGQKWDGTGIAFRVDLWEQVYRVMKPGAYLLAFGGTRTYHRMACAIEDAGFVIKDSLHWIYAQGFPKSLQVDEAMKKAGMACNCGGSTLPYSHDSEAVSEHDLRLVRGGHVPPPLDTGNERGQVLLSGLPEQGAPDQGEQLPDHARPGQSGVEGRRHLLSQAWELQADQVCPVPGGVRANGTSGRLRDGAPADHGPNGGLLPPADGSGPPPRPRSAEQPPQQPRIVANEQQPQTGGAWPHCGRCGLPIVPPLSTALKPAHEPIVLAQKPLDGTYANNVARHGVGALDIDGCRVATDDDNSRTAGRGAFGLINDDGWVPKLERTEGSPLGRWPTNLLLSHIPPGPDGTGGCVPVGTRRVKSPVKPYVQQTESGGYGGDLGKVKGMQSTHYADADALETVAAWECVAGCPVRLLDEQSGERPVAGRVNRKTKAGYGFGDDRYGESGVVTPQYYDQGGSSRFFPTFAFEADDFAPFKYVAKASRSERRAGLPPDMEATHPTVKPLALVSWLVRLICPPGEICLDPFAGSGTTAVACTFEGRDCIAIERESEYVEIARLRIAWAETQAQSRTAPRPSRGTRGRPACDTTGITQLGLPVDSLCPDLAIAGKG